jgi:hypothetical protein
MGTDIHTVFDINPQNDAINGVGELAKCLS